jgi:hypothetical protein
MGKWKLIEERAVDCSWCRAIVQMTRHGMTREEALIAGVIGLSIGLSETQRSYLSALESQPRVYMLEKPRG